MDERTFGWVSTYQAIATELVNYEHRQDELCEIVEAAIGESHGEMDPFTFFSMFNGKRIRYESRSVVVRLICERLGLDVDVPEDFDGVPTTNPLRWRYWDGRGDTVPDIWRLFKVALAFADGDAGQRSDFVRLFDVVHGHRNIGDANLTMALYWIRPKTFLALDSLNKKYVPNRYDIQVRTPVNGESYLALIESVREAVHIDFVHLSYAAWEAKGWIPAPVEYDPHISADTWVTLLGEEGLVSAEMHEVLRCMAKYPKGVTCSELDDEFGRGANFYNANISSLGKAVCGRLGIEARDVGEGGGGRYWPVVCMGSYVDSRKRLGSFEWRLRDEVLEAVGRISQATPEKGGEMLSPPAKVVKYDRKRLQRIVDLYKEDFHRFRGADAPGGDQEVYKWKDVRAYRDHWNIEAEGAEFAEGLKRALKPAASGQGQLLGNSFSYPFSRLSKLVDYDPDAIRDAFRILFDPERPLRAAYADFTDAVDEVLERFNETEDELLKGSHQNPSAASLYLAFERPGQYHLLKPNVGFEFAALVGVKLPAGALAKMLSYQTFADAVLPELLADEELVSMSDAALTPELREVDPAHHMMLQDVSFYANYYLKQFHPDWESLVSGEAEASDGSKDVPAENVTYPKNMILFGPPGTGKTYQSRAYAVAICDGRRIEDVLDAMRSADGRQGVAERYHELVDQGRIAFATFHQSYGYEEFIEGLRPEYDEDKGVVTYPLRTGVFKAFCETAEDVVAMASAEKGLPRYASNPHPRVWKMGLACAEVEDLYEQCRLEGSLRMGFDEVAVDGTDVLPDSFSKQNVRSIHLFQEGLQQGDFVVVPGPLGKSYDLAVVTGDFEWDESAAGAKRRRSAQWVGSIDRDDFLVLNGGKPLKQQLVYELSRVSLSALLVAAHLIDEMGGTHALEPYVFIIDEINRGNVSKIFGELITTLEEGKRKDGPEEQLVVLPYSQQRFGVPSNVHVLGTMNTADRSITQLDTALRRRFEFIEIMPDPKVLENVIVEGVDISRMLAIMNRRIELLYDRDHTLGHSYLMRLVEEPTLEVLAHVFDTNLIPLLQEYFFDDYKKIRLVLGRAADRFIAVDDAFDVFFDDDSFDMSQLKSYRVLRAPIDAEAYGAIYSSDGRA